MQTISALSYAGQRIRVSAFVRGDNIAAAGRLYVEGFAGTVRRFYVPAGDNRLTGTFDWRQEAVVVDVPRGTDTISFGIALRGVGTLWIDDVKIENVPETVKLTRPVYPDEPGNLDFEKGTDGWVSLSKAMGEYQTSIETGERFSGLSSFAFRSLVPDPKQPRTLLQSCKADRYRAQRVRVSGYLKTVNLAGHAFLWFRVDGAKEPLAFHNTNRNSIRGTSPWTQREIVLDVSPEAMALFYGVVVVGSGTVYVDHFDVEVVDISVPVSSRTLPTHSLVGLNLDFEGGRR